MDAVLKESIRQRAGNCCEYCHLPQEFSELQFHVEHVIPRQHGGSDELGNLALACPECNLVKGPNLTSIDPTTKQIVRLFHPREQIWDDHFVYDGARIVGRTPTGRATVSLFRLNEEEKLRVRGLVKKLS